MSANDVQRAVRSLWWLVLIRGILGVLFGLFALFVPGLALLALVYAYGFYAIMDGVVALLLGFRNRGMSHWGWHIAQGVVSVLAGIAALVWPGLTALVLVFIIAAWSIVLGITEIMEAFTARRLGSTSWGWLLATGILAILFGVVLVASPGAGALALIGFIGAFALLFGILVIVWAFRLRRAATAVDAL